MKNYMRKLSDKIEAKEEELFELRTEIIGSKVVYDGREVIVMEVDWEEKMVFLNYDDENFEWVSFE